MTFVDDVKNKKVLIFGLGLQGGGLGDVQWLAAHEAQVRVTDQKTAPELSSTISQLPQGVELSLGGHSEIDIEWADIIIKNPGVPDNHPLLKIAQHKGIPVLTSIAVLVREARDKVIGITGTRGKSTTTELIYRLLDSQYPGEILRGGNIPGTSGLMLLNRVGSARFAVLELSSFQLHNFHELKISPHIAVVTNLYPDHLNRYVSIEEYAQDKAAIAHYQQAGDFVIENGDNDGALQIARESRGEHLQFNKSDVPSDWQIKLRGDHNRENIAAVIAVSRALNIPIERVKNTVESFHGIPFRLENRGSVNGITYINDTASTTPTAAIKAIAAMTTPTIVIVGGDDKKLPWDLLAKMLAESPAIKKIVILGSEHIPDFVNALRKVCGDKIVGPAYSMADAVAMGTQHAIVGDTVLLSPGFSSFDLFQNEFDRGRQFNECVKALEK